MERLFRDKGMHEQADWMRKLRDHVNEVGTEAALRSLGEEVKGRGEEVQYAGHSEVGQFAEAYLDRHGISLVHGSAPEGERRAISTVSASSDAEGVHGRGDPRDVFPRLQGLRDKLHEAQSLPGLESSRDLGELAGGAPGDRVSHFTPQLVSKLDEQYGKGQWVVKPYDDDAYAGKGIYFPQKVERINQDARNTVWAAGEHLGKYGFKVDRDGEGRAIGIVHSNGDRYVFGTDRYRSTINGDAREWGDKVHAASEHERAAALELGRSGNQMRYMAQPAFPAVGISNEERAAGVTFKTGQEGRVHVTTKNGRAEIVPHSTWMKGEHLPVVFESDDSRAMAQAAVDAINALPRSERQGQLYAPDVMRTAGGFKVVEANPANEAGASGYLQDNPLIIDSYVSHLTGREPGHVAFVRRLLSGKAKSSAEKAQGSPTGNRLVRVLKSLLGWS